ncbi:MAG: RNA-binding protein [Puniceicoccales bacterium]|jgi:RNA recognition motif-containing protein|nr:RNA-binding protein [Puniceicoccales bacterium]
MDNKLFVGNLAWGATEEDLQKYFSQYGTVQQIEVMRDRVTGRARGFAFVTMGSDEEALNAANSAEGQEFMGRPLKVNVARPREERPAGERRSFDGPRGGGGDRGGFRPRRPFSGGGDRGGYSGDRPRRSFGDRRERGDRGGREGGGY